MSEQHANGIAYVDNLRLSWREEQALVRLAETEDSQQAQDSGRERRKTWRRLFVARSGVLLGYETAHQQSVPFRVIPRNLSEGGMAVLTGGFAYVDTVVVVTFLLDGNETLQVRGVVRRCGHVQGKIHDVGIEFDAPLKSSMLFDENQDLEKIEGLEGGDDSDAMKVFHGSVLYLKNDPMQQRMVCYLLDRLGLEVSTVDSCRGAVLAMGERKFGMLMADVQHVDGPELAFVRALRGRGLDKPIVAVAAEGDEKLCRAVMDAGFTGILVKPLTLNKLRTNISKWLNQALPKVGVGSASESKTATVAASAE